MEYREYGHFAEGGAGYVITERKTPRHWYNYFFNATFNSFASQVGYGEGFAEDRLGSRIFLISDRCVYVTDRENGTFHTAVGLPVTEKFDHYECRHNLGSTVITCEKNGVRTEYTIFVPEKGEFEQWIVRVTNLRGRAARLGVIGYAATETDNVYRPQGYNSEEAHYDAENGLIYSTMMTKMHHDRLSRLYPYFACDGTPDAYDTRKTAFLGTYGTKTEPEALVEHGGCTNSDCFVEKVCYALEKDFELAAGESAVVYYKIGYAVEKEDLSIVKDGIADAEALLAAVTRRRAEEICAVTIRTPDEKLDRAFEFYKYAALMGSRWARVRHNGFRDRTGDSEALSAVNPRKAWENIKLALSYQYSTGYAPRTVIDGAIRPNNFADNAVWIAMAVYSVVMETGELSLLNEVVPFNDGTEDTVYEHVRRSVVYLRDFRGENGLIKIWGGDWYDGMNLAGLEGKGVSVWLSIAWCRSNKLLAELSRLTGKDEVAAQCEKDEAAMEDLIEKYGWDGEYYITAINDLGVKIGSKESKYGKMHLNPQTWAIFAEIGTEERRRAIYDKVEEVLETPLGTHVNYPPYEEPDDHIGFMTFRPAETLINAGIYMHPMGWKVAAEAMLKRPDRVEATIRKMLPWDHEYAMSYGEPYILYNMYHGPKAGYRNGTPGQSWRTGSSAVLMKNIVRFVFGLDPDLEGLKIKPVLPPSWKECGIRKTFRGCTYDISFRQADTHTCTVEKILVDGAEWKEEHLPLCAGKTFKVEVFVK